MSNIKERLIGAITVMSEEEARSIWEMLERQHFPRDWSSIEEIEPDEIDMQLLSEAQTDPDCQNFVSANEASKILDNLQ